MSSDREQSAGHSEAELTDLLESGSALHQRQRYSLPPFVVYGVQASAAGIAATLIMDVVYGMSNKVIRLRMLRYRMMLGAWMTGLYVGGTEYVPPPQVLRDAFGWHRESSPYKSFAPDSDRVHPWFRSAAQALGFGGGSKGGAAGGGSDGSSSSSGGSSSAGSTS